MRAFQASEVVLIQAIESVDEDGELLGFEERRQADAALEGEGAGSPLEALSARAELLSPHVKRRAPWLWQTTHRFSKISWSLTFVCMAVALFFGASVQVLDGGKTFHVFSFPLLGLIIWNFFSLGLLLLGPYFLGRFFASREREEKDVVLEKSSWGGGALRLFLWFQRKWIGWRRPETGGYVEQVSWKVLEAYWREWPRHAGALLRAQTARTLHLSTVAFGVSALLAAYAGGLTKAYRATRESTFLGGVQVEWLLNLIFTPSQWLLGPIPSLKGGVSGLLGPAAPWIHHYAVTIFVFVLVPRLLLFVWMWLQEMWLTARLPLSLEFLSQAPTLNVALASHTNVGKTSLARTLLRRDVGEVRDAEHVTRRRAGYFLIHTPEASLRLWDTPGFGDAQALTQNLKEREGWAWLRALQEPKLRFDREAALSLKEEADLILYLVPAHGGPEVERTLRAEWEVLREIDCPVLCLLNRLKGVSAAQEETLLVYWREFLKSEPLCREVLSLDAFSRSLEDEQALFEAIERAVKPERKPLARQLKEIWKEQSEHRHKAASTMVASVLRLLSKDKERDTGKEAGQRLQGRAQRSIAETQSRLLGHMGLKGEIQDRMISESEAFLRSVIPNRGERTIGAIIGGALSGLASGIVTDFLAGGLTFFGGAAVGMVLGALGGAGVAEGYRRAGTKGARDIVWDQDFLQGVALRMTLLYLAAASFGRAKGDFTDEAFLSAASTSSTKKKEAAIASSLESVETHALLFQAAETALKSHWPYLWPFLQNQHGPPPKKLWEKVLPGVGGKPAWVQAVTEEQDGRRALPFGGELEEGDPFERGCAALLSTALEEWSRLRQESTQTTYESTP